MLVHFLLLFFSISAMKSKIDSITTAAASNELPLLSHQPKDFTKRNPPVVDNI